MNDTVSDQMIEGVNPLSISRFAKFNFYRNNVHPLANRLARKRHPIATRIPFINWFYLYTEGWDYIQLPGFEIIGSDGGYIKTVRCQSYAERDRRLTDAQMKLNTFLENIQKEIK